MLLAFLGNIVFGETSFGETSLLAFGGNIVWGNVVRGNVIWGNIIRGNIVRGITVVPFEKTRNFFAEIGVNIDGIFLTKFQGNFFGNFSWKTLNVYDTHVSMGHGEDMAV
jgi:hypothetical protein